MHQVRFPFVRPFFLTQSTSCSDVRRWHGVTAAIAVDVVAVHICMSVRPSVHGVWHYINTNVGWQNHLYLPPKNLSFGSQRFWQKTAVFSFGLVTVTALMLTESANCDQVLQTSDNIVLIVVVNVVWLIKSIFSLVSYCYFSGLKSTVQLFWTRLLGMRRRLVDLRFLQKTATCQISSLQ